MKVQVYVGIAPWLAKSGDYTQNGDWQRDFGRITGKPEIIHLAEKRATRTSDLQASRKVLYESITCAPRLELLLPQIPKQFDRRWAIATVMIVGERKKFQYFLVRHHRLE